MTTIARHRVHSSRTHQTRPTGLARAVLAGAAAGFGVLLGVSIEDLTTRDRPAG